MGRAAGCRLSFLALITFIGVIAAMVQILEIVTWSGIPRRSTTGLAYFFRWSR